jgi:hypothetical protein
MKIAVLGAQGSGKSQLARELTHRLCDVTAGGVAANVLIADAPALMAAIYFDLEHDDQKRCKAALTEHKIYDLTLVTGLDIPCRGGKQRLAEASRREAVDARLRLALTRGGIAYAVIYGQGPARVETALKAISSWRGDRVEPVAPGSSRRQWSCEKCSDPECEHRMFTGLLEPGNR